MASTRRASRLVPRPARRLYRYWHAERRTLRQGLVALALSTLASFVAGLTLASITGTLSSLPGLLVLIPAAVGMRGTIFGAIGARLGTASAAGMFEANLRRGGVLAQNVEVSFITTFTSSLWLAGLAKLATAAFGEPSISFWDLVTISVVGGVLGSVLILVVTLGLSVVSYRRGYDLDAVATPMVTALGDMGTLPMLYLATFLVAQRRRERHRRGPVHRAVRAGRGPRMDDARRAGPTDRAGDDRGDRADAAARHRRRRAAAGARAGAGAARRASTS